jgi:tetratricopeptide (TPR) repeat protein
MSSDLEFNAALELHKAGRLDEAEAAYRDLLARRPRHFDAQHLLGVIASQRGQFDRAITLIRAAIVMDPKRPAAFANLGNALMGAGRADEAAEAYRRALALDANLAEALFGLGNALRETDPDEAISAYEKAIAQRPAFVEAMANLASLQLARERAPVSLDLWLRASQLRPNAANLYIGAAKALTALERTDEAAQLLRGLGQISSVSNEDLFDAANALASARRFEDAARLYREILRRDPSLFPVLNNLGNMLRELGRLEEAEAAYRMALNAAPDDVGIICNRALILKDLGRAPEALAEVQRSIALKPTPVGHSNLGLLWMGENKIEEALAEFTAAEALAPGDPDLVFHQGVALLHLGRFAEGWRKYEGRWGQRRSRERKRAFPQPQWMGEDIEGRTILLHSEQGFGDTLQFVRYAPLVAERGARVVLECQPPLKRLMRETAGVAEVVARGESLPAFDLFVPLMSLPLVFGTALETVPGRVPYIRPPAEAVAAWADVAAGHDRPRIGLVWAGDARHYDVESNLIDQRRSVTLEAYAPLLGLPGVEFFSLQVGPLAGQARAFPQIVDHTPRIKDFADTAALVAHLDLVISVDTAVVHLAGALGKPVWVLSRFDNCWRWMREREDSPWYPQLRLYRQPAPRAWGPVLERLAADLRQWLDQHKRV